MNSELPDGFLTRLKTAVNNAGGGAEVARRTGIPRRSLENYLSGISPPKLAPLAKIADVTNASLDWLVTGKTSGGTHGLQMHEKHLPNERSSDIQGELIVAAVQVVDEWLLAKGRTLRPDLKGKVVAALVEEALERAGHMTPDALQSSAARMLRLVA